MSETGTELDVRRRRAVWRATHRGTKEMDIMIGQYAQAVIPEMGELELARLERFLVLQEPDLQRWLLAGDGDVADGYGDLVTAIRAFHGLS